jgi:hypothetical protein
MEIVLSTGQRGVAQVAWRSPARDLVLLHTDLELPVAELEAAGQQRAGEAVVVLGYPRPDAQGDTNLVASDGQIVAVRRDQESITELLTDAPMDPGVSGGAVVNSRGLVVGVPSYGPDPSSGLYGAVGAEEVQALLNEPHAPATSDSLYQGDPRNLLPTADRMDGTWRSVPMPEIPSKPSASGAAGPVLELLISGDPNATSGPYAELRPTALVAPDAEHARWAWERGLRHPPSDFVRQPDPPLATACHAYEMMETSATPIQAAVVTCREANVVVGVAMSSTPEISALDTAVRTVGQMVAQVRQAAQ